MNTMSSTAGAVIGTIADFSSEGRPRVNIPSADGVGLHEARSCVRLGAEDVGRSVVVVFEERCLDKPIIVGTLSGSDDWTAGEMDLPADVATNPVTVDLDGRRVELSAKEEIVLRCGKASITLTRAGKVLIRGAYVSSHSTSVNRIKGGSVEIN